jgi:hypothetical protein
MLLLPGYNAVHLRLLDTNANSRGSVPFWNSIGWLHCH